jgi:SAM-dependent methyltransferase
LPWNDPDFAERMLRQHLDQSHGAASRNDRERAHQIAWLVSTLQLPPGARVLDVTCGPGLYAVDLAGRGCTVTGIDFSPAAIAYARTLAEEAGVAGRCMFREQDVRHMALEPDRYDAALLIYGQLGVFPPTEAQQLLQTIAGALRPGGRLCVELLNKERVPKEHRSWWHTGDSGLWGDTPFLCLGETIWYPEESIALDRFYLLYLETGEMREITIADRIYGVAEMRAMMRDAGFQRVQAFPDSAGLPLNDALEWVLYVAEK